MPAAETPTAADLQAKPAPIEAPAPAAKGTEAPKKPESFRESMRRLGGDRIFEDEQAPPETEEASGTGGGEEQPSKADASKAAPEKPAKKPPATEVQVSPDAKEAEFKAWAEKQGLLIENGRVTTAERAKFREERRNHSETLKTAESAALAKIEEARKTFEKELSSARALQAAVDSGDANALAKALGRDDWNKLQEHFLSHQADPNYKKLLELEEWKKKTEAEREEQEKQRTEREQQQAQLRLQQQYRTQLSGQMKGSKDQLIAAMAEDPLFVGAVFNIQRNHYDGSSTVTPEQAIKIAPPNGRSLYDEMKALHERLSKAFGGAAAAGPAGTEATAATPPVKKAPKTPPAPPTPLPSKLNRKQGDREWMKYANDRLTEARIEEERAARRG